MAVDAADHRGRRLAGRGAEGRSGHRKIFAKTGTLAAGNFFNEQILFPAKALGGFMDAKSGRRLAFAIVAGNSTFSDIDGAFAANDDVGKVATLIQQSY